MSDSADTTAVARVLVVEDEASVRWVINRALTAGGHQVVEAADGIEALDAMGQSTPDVVLLDWMLPRMDGLEVLAEIRKQGDTPVMMLTGMAGETQRISGLDGGADDYLVKPFSIGELEARVRALLRRAGRRVAAAAAPDGGPLVIDRAAREVRLHGEPVALTRKEFDVLVYLADRPRQVVSPAELLEHVWQSSVAWQDPATVKEHVRRLRLKIEPDPAKPVFVRTVRGAGFRFEPAT